MAATPATGVRHLKLTIKDGSSPQKARTLLCTSLSVPEPTKPEMVKVKPEGDLVAILPADSVESTFKIGVLVESFINSTLPTLSEILNGTGLGADWTPINSTLSTVAVDTTYRVFSFTAELNGATMGGTTTYRSWSGVITAPAEISRANPNVIEYTGEVQGSITDSTTAP